ncbi:MAG: phosphonate ABC transporter substrate-binding protein [Geobacteraceae bacterium GWC2_58_44]|nr:MAG: phosphonate ABC transporter substrate-binding protein [Geobacteraceae bacterium GWC2_58_44]HBG08356.1 phosphonate ABC transporter substrate-binding protein [Geobacter sp.]
MRVKITAISAGLLLLGTVLLGESAFCAEKPLVRFGVSLRFHPITMYERYQPMMDYLTRNTPYRFELKISRDYRETIQFLNQRKTDVASIGDGGVMKAMLLSGAIPIVKPLNGAGRPTYRSCAIVPSGSPIRSMQDLKGKSIAFGYHHSTTGNLIPRLLLQESRIKLGDLGSVTNLRHHSDVARAVLKGEYDAGFVKESTAIRFSKKGLRVILCSEELPSIPLIARRDAPKELVAAIAAALVKLDSRNPEHRKIMDNWDIEYKNGFVPATTADYRALSGMFRKRPYGCGTGCHK